MEQGRIGTPVTGTAFMLGRGMEHWHPDPAFYYQTGAGPVMDMGPYYLTMLVNLMGPVRRVQAVATSGQSERLITAAGPLQGTRFKVGTATSVLSLLEFDCGATVTFGASWDVFRHSNHPIELHGTEGSLRLPDPDNFGGQQSFGLLGIAVGMLFASLTEILVGGIDLSTALVGYFTPAFIGNAIVTIILLPILMVAYQGIAASRGR